MRRAWIMTNAILCILAVSPRARGQELEGNHVRPVEVSTGLNVHNSAITWDGEVFVYSANTGKEHTLAMTAVAVRPAAITTDTHGVAVLTNAFSTPVLFNPGLGIPQGSDSDFGMTPAAGYDQNPFPSDALGNPKADGAYMTYEVFVIWNYAGDNGLEGIQGQIVVANPMTASASIQQAGFIGSPQFIQTSSGDTIQGGNTQIAFDGHFMIYHDNAVGTAYTYNQNQASATGWSTPAPLTSLYLDANTVVAGLPLGVRYPLAQKQLMNADGSLIGAGTPFDAVYFWVSFDAAEMSYSAIRQTQDKNQPTQFSMIGRATGWIARHLDGPINPDSQTTAHGHFTSPGMTRSFWTPYRFQPGVLPYTGVRPDYFLIGNQGGGGGGGQIPSFEEIDMQDALDQDYVLVQHMNELVTRSGHSGTCTVDFTHTPDTSGNFNTGTLEGAQFPLQYSGNDIHPGMVGNCVYCRLADRVRVPSSATIAPVNSLTVQIFVKRLASMAMNVAQLPGAWTMAIDANGYLNVTIQRADGSTKTSGPVGSVIPVSVDDGDTDGTGWVSLAFSYDATSGCLVVYAGGVKVCTKQFDEVALAATTADLLVGPSASSQTSTAVLMIDELYVSRVIRTPVEIARNAFVNLAQQALAPPPPNLPLGLSAADLRIPAAAPTSPAIVTLGQQLFFDPRVSRNASLSCASCHQPALDLTDGLPIARGMGGQVLVRNTPSLFNRAFSTLQFFDGRAHSLEKQSAMPIENPGELDSSIAELVHFLEASPEYSASFQNALGGAPSRQTIEAAFAGFERSLMTGDSKVDRFEAGDQNALDGHEQNGRLLFRGKARCITCHGGSNYTDELFHDTGNTKRTDPGRISIQFRTANDLAFKTPSLRNLQLTGPYLHDGSVGTLRDLVDLYNQGGMKGVNQRDRELRPLQLSDAECFDLVAFLNALQNPSTVAMPMLPADPGPGSTTLTNQGFDADLSGWDSGDESGASWLDAEKNRTSPATGIAVVQPLSETIPSFIEQAVYIVPLTGGQTTVTARVSKLADAGPQPTALLRVRDASGVFHDAKGASQTLSFSDGWVTLSSDLSAYRGQTITIRVEARVGTVGVDAVKLK